VGLLDLPFIQGLPWVKAWGPATPEYIYAPVLNAVALAGCILGSLATRPVDEATILNFFRRVRPHGWWGPVRARAGLTAAQLHGGQDRLRLIVLNTLLGMVALFSLYLVPLYLIGHWFQWCALSALVCAAAVAVLYRTWYRRLEEELEPVNKPRA